jgi:hypothetical protein
VDLLWDSQGGVDSAHAISSADTAGARKELEGLRERTGLHTAAMYIVSNATRDPSGGLASCFSQVKPEAVVLRLIVKAALNTSSALLHWLADGSLNSELDTSGLLCSEAAERMSNVMLKFNPKLSLHPESIDAGNTGNRLWAAFSQGPASAQLKLFSNLSPKELGLDNMMIL